MEMSPEISELAKALSAAQRKIQPAVKDKVNPHFKSSYADLASVWDACRTHLADAGLSVVQGPRADEAKVSLTTMLLHTSGQWMRSELTMTAQQNTPQAIGSCLTYLRRYALAAMVGIAPAEDDGNAASGNGRPAAVEVVEPPAGYVEWLVDFSNAANHGLVALRQTFKNARLEYREHLTKHDQVRYEQIKVRAGQVELPEKATAR